MLLLPFALVRELEGSALMIPVACLVGIFLFGIEELGVQLEEPFSIMPVEDIGDSLVHNSCCLTTKPYFNFDELTSTYYHCFFCITLN